MQTGRVLSAAVIQVPIKRVLILFCAPLLALGMNACASTSSSNAFKGESHAVAQTIINLQTEATAGEAARAGRHTRTDGPGGPATRRHERERSGEEHLCRQEQNQHANAGEGKRSLEDLKAGLRAQLRALPYWRS